MSQKWMSFADATGLMTKELPELDLRLKDVVTCYGLSKMTVANEMQFKGVNPYLKMQFVEFLEYVGRVADFKYAEMDAPLYQKIEEILKVVFSVINAKVNPMKRVRKMQKKASSLANSKNIQIKLISKDIKSRLRTI